MVIDLAALSFISSLGIGALVGLARGLKEQGGSLRLAAPQPPIRERENREALNDVVIETQSLRLRPWREADRAPLAAMHAHPEVMADYGGPIENRARFALEATDAAISVWGADRVGMHLNPRASSHGMGDSNPAATFGYLARDYGLKELYLWPINADEQGTPKQVKRVIDVVRKERIPVVFSESTISDKPARQVAKETGARYGGVLYVDSLSDERGPVPSYLKLLEVTVDTVAKGFGK